MNSAHGVDSAPGDAPPPAELIEQVAARLRRVCAHMEPEQFNALVLSVARFTMRWGDERPRPH
jgi:hypothetical protein